MGTKWNLPNIGSVPQYLLVRHLQPIFQLFEVQVATPPSASDVVTIQGLGGAPINHEPFVLGAGKDLLFVFPIILATRAMADFHVDVLGTVQPAGSACQ
jgi:hypothetical protein